MRPLTETTEDLVVLSVEKRVRVVPAGVLVYGVFAKALISQDKTCLSTYFFRMRR
jgi:hypothetical protein